MTVKDQRWELIGTDKMTFPETRELKRVSGGMSLVEVQQGIEGADPDAWFAWLFVSIKRAWPALTVRELEAGIGDTPIVSIIESLEQEAPEVADPDPPPQASLSGEPMQQNGNGSGEKIPPLSTLATHGPPT